MHIQPAFMIIEKRPDLDISSNMNNAKIATLV